MSFTTALMSIKPDVPSTMIPMLLPRSSFVCRSCREINRQSIRTAVSIASTNSWKARRLGILQSIHLDRNRSKERLRRYNTQSVASFLRWPFLAREAKVVPKIDLSDPEYVLHQVIAESDEICSASVKPDDLRIIDILETGRQLSEALVYGEVNRPNSDAEEFKSTDTPTSSVLGLEESIKDTAEHPGAISTPFRKEASAALAEKLYSLLCDPKVQISSKMLKIYVGIQVLLSKPEYLPEVFHLYAHKPIPHSSKLTQISAAAKPRYGGADPTAAARISFKPARPRLPTNAISLSIASAALTSTIAVKSLPLALSVIETTMATPAFRVQKVFNRCALPFTLLAFSPLAVYSISSHIAHNLQNTYDPTLATWLTFGGIMTYLASTVTMGFIALTTGNDQMLRVTWRPGMPLRDRWLREEERWAFDQIALAWGFKEKKKWGEERGEDWEALREFCGRRGMILDKTNLLEGME